MTSAHVHSLYKQDIPLSRLDFFLGGSCEDSKFDCLIFEMLFIKLNTLFAPNSLRDCVRIFYHYLALINRAKSVCMGES